MDVRHLGTEERGRFECDVDLPNAELGRGYERRKVRSVRPRQVRRNVAESTQGLLDPAFLGFIDAVVLEAGRHSRNGLGRSHGMHLDGLEPEVPHDPNRAIQIVPGKVRVCA